MSPAPHTVIMSSPTVPIIDYSAMIAAAREARAEMIHQLVAPYAAGVVSVVEFVGLVLLGLTALTALILGVKTREFTWALVGLATCMVLGILLPQLLALSSLTWTSIGLGAGVLAFCAIAGRRVAMKVLNLLF